MRDELEQVRQRLLREAFLYDDPAAFVAGVEQALAALEARLRQAVVA